MLLFLGFCMVVRHRIDVVMEVLRALDRADGVYIECSGSTIYIAVDTRVTGNYVRKEIRFGADDRAVEMFNSIRKMLRELVAYLAKKELDQMKKDIDEAMKMLEEIG